MMDARACHQPGSGWTAGSSHHPSWVAQTLSMALTGGGCNRPASHRLPWAPSSLTDQTPANLPAGASSAPPAPATDPLQEAPNRGSVRILVTSGPTWEPIDAVRYLGNRSSGRIGVEIARAAAELDHPVTLLKGPGTVDPTPHPQIRTVRFQSARDLERELHARWPEHDLLFMAAAVADFTPRGASDRPEKLRRENGPMTLDLDPVPDLLARLARVPHPGTRIGFALEPATELEDRARSKMTRKELQGIVANPLETMESDEIEGRLLLPDGTSREPAGGRISKRLFADWLVETTLSIHRGTHEAGSD